MTYEETAAKAKKMVRRQAHDIYTQVTRLFGDRLGRVGGQLFLDNDGTSHVTSLDRQEAFFASLHAAAHQVTWRSGPGNMTKAEFFEYARNHAPQYDEVQSLPHFPPLPGIYYRRRVWAPGNGELLTKLVSMFRPKTPADAQMILAAFASLFWGGAAGDRPIIVITAPAGRGTGKSKLAETTANLAGGFVSLSKDDDFSRVITRLLSEGARGKRAVLWDNVKATKISWAELEAAITQDILSGHRLYAGEGTRPNYLTFLVTVNGPLFSRDIAQRVVVIELGKPVYSPAWNADLRALCERREELISDIASFFQRQPTQLQHHSRWSTWELRWKDSRLARRSRWRHHYEESHSYDRARPRGTADAPRSTALAPRGH